MKRWLYFAYGVVNHGIFLGVYAYLACFVGDFLVPKTIDAPVSSTGAAAVAINLGLVLLFAAQHSIMARPAFKRVWTQFVPQPVERSTYVLVANVVTVLLMWFWQPIDTIVWDVQQPILRAIGWTLFAIGWLTVPAITLIIDHFDLFGTRQVWLHLRGKEYTSLPFQARMAYRFVRHPLYLGWALAFWATPTMTVGHVLFAGTMSIYMVLAAMVEERDLVAHFGHRYEAYRRSVPMFVPRVKPSDTVLPEPATQNT
jgi:protein-S-isoprenylcysteine O-methyltransferase Ste14